MARLFIRFFAQFQIIGISFSTKLNLSHMTVNYFIELQVYLGNEILETFDN